MAAKNDVRVLVDTIRDPRDMAELIHVAIATGRTVSVTGNSITHDHPKVVGQIESWMPGYRQNTAVANVNYHSDFFEQIKEAKSNGYTVVGTSPNEGESIYQTDLSKGKHILVFGTEVGGLSKKKMVVMDQVIQIPMLHPTRFYLLRTAIPIILHEALRQKGFFESTAKEKMKL